MGERKQIKISLGTIFLVVIIIGLICACVAMYMNSNYEIVPKDEEIVENEPGNEEEVPENVENEDANINLYEKYSGLYWHIKDNKDDKTKTEFAGKEIKIEDGTAYLYSGNKKEEITSVTGNAKYVLMWGKQTLDRVYIFTQDGKVWKSECDGELNSDFDEIKLPAKFVDITGGDSTVRVVEPPYFLLANGSLVNENGESYEDTDAGYEKTFGNGMQRIYAKADGELYWYDEETEEYIMINDVDGDSLKMRDAFTQWSTTRNDLVEETGGDDRSFVITEDGELVYFDGYEEVEVKEYKKASGKKVRSAIEEKIPDEYGGNYTVVKVTFTDGTSIEIVDATKTVIE